MSTVTTILLKEAIEYVNQLEAQVGSLNKDNRRMANHILHLEKAAAKLKKALEAAVGDSDSPPRPLTVANAEALADPPGESARPDSSTVDDDDDDSDLDDSDLDSEIPF